MRVGFWFVIILLASIAACKKPPEALSDSDNIPSVAFAVSLADSLPARTFATMKVADVTGIKIVNLAGRDVRYFEYEGNIDTILKALSDSPFDVDAPVADLTCRVLPAESMKALLMEVNDDDNHAFSVLGNANPEALIVYECRKYPLTHHIFFNAGKRKIIHRIERS